MTMRPTERLTEEHEKILAVLDVQEALCADIRRGEEPPAGLCEQIVTFMRVFADDRHHHKEEELLFPALERAGLPRDGGPVGVMLHEHEIGRALIARMAEAAERWSAGDVAGLAAFGTAAAEHASLLRAHIQKENQILFPMAERFLDADTKRDLAAQFEARDAARGDRDRPGALLAERARIG
jgi:hemerythrin-like domain-containing protein